VQYLVDTTSRLTGNKPSEMQWRLDLEKIVYKRFELDIDWYERIFPDQHVRLYLIFNSPEPMCKRRWWRSDIEVVSEPPGSISKSVEERRNIRSACCCSAGIRLKNQYGGPGQKSPDYRASDAEGTLKSRIEIARTR
jgi:hypothetical protein